MKKNNSLMAGNGEKGKWVTINGAHVFVEDGQTVDDAMTKQFSKGERTKASEKERLKKILSERGQSEDEDFAKDTNYFGYGSLDELEKAHQAGYKKSIDQDKARDDKYTLGNPNNINKSTTVDAVEKDISHYKGNESVDLVLPGGKWVQVRPQKDGTYLVRTNNGSKYVSSVDEVKTEVSSSFTSKKNSSSDELRNKKVNELMSFGYTKEQSEQAFDASVEFWQKQLNCDRETAIKISAKND